MTANMAAQRTQKKEVIRPDISNRYQVSGTGIQGEIFIIKDLDTLTTTANTLTTTVTLVADA